MQAQKQDIIYFGEDISSSDVNESMVGRKGLSLIQLKEIDVPVPSFFVISPEVYTDLIARTFGDQMDSYLKEKKLPDPMKVRDALLNMEFTPEVQEELLKAYAKLSGFSQSWVSVRSSVVYLPDGNTLFPGVFKTEVNVRGYEDLLTAIKNVYASVFTDAVVGYAREQNVDLSQLRMAVVIQKMIQAEVSGITYTQDLITQDAEKLSIEAVFGLGDVISTGEITPDRYVFKKDDLSFLEKKISPQDWMHVRALKSKGTGGIEKISISSAWSHRQKLEDRFLREIAKTCLLIEDTLGAYQNIEWVWESGRVWVIQHKSIYTPREQTASVAQGNQRGVMDPVLGVLKHQEQSSSVQAKADIQAELKKMPTKKKDIDPVSQIERDLEVLRKQENLPKSSQVDTSNVVQQEEDRKEKQRKLEQISQKFAKMSEKEASKKQKKVDKETKNIQKKKANVIGKVAKNFLNNNLDSNKFSFLLNGIGVSSGTKVGQVLHVNAKNYKDLVISREHIIIVDEVFDGLREIIFRAGGVLMDTGGISSDVAIQCREFAIPAVVGAASSSHLLKDGDFAKIDAGSGGVYIYAEKEEENEVTKKSVKEDKGVEKQDAIEYEIVDDVEKKFDDFDTTTFEEAEEPKKSCEHVNVPRTATKVYVNQINLADSEDYIFEYSDGFVSLDLEELMLGQKRHPLSFVEDGNTLEYFSKMAKTVDEYAKKFVNSEVMISLGSHTSDDFATLVKGKTFEKPDRTRGVSRYLMYPEFTKLALKIVSRARNVHRNKNISLAFHSPLNSENMKSIKKHVLTAGLRRSSSFKLYAIVDNPSEVLLIDDIVSTSIDGLVINTPTLARQMQGLSIDDDKAHYSLENNSLFKTLESIMERLHSKNVEIIGITENCEPLIERYIELGACGVGVSADYFLEAKRFISEKETQIILSRGRI